MAKRAFPDRRTRDRVLAGPAGEHDVEIVEDDGTVTLTWHEGPATYTLNVEVDVTVQHNTHPQRRYWRAWLDSRCEERGTPAGWSALLLDGDEYSRNAEAAVARHRTWHAGCPTAEPETPAG